MSRDYDGVINIPQWMIDATPMPRLPRKQKKRIIKTAGRENYRAILQHMRKVYAMFGYRKFNIKVAFYLYSTSNHNLYIMNYYRSDHYSLFII